jgi:hypothetical protein
MLGRDRRKQCPEDYPTITVLLLHFLSMGKVKSLVPPGRAVPQECVGIRRTYEGRTKLPEEGPRNEKKRVFP